MNCSSLLYWGPAFREGKDVRGDFLPLPPRSPSTPSRDREEGFRKVLASLSGACRVDVWEIPCEGGEGMEKGRVEGKRNIIKKTQNSPNQCERKYLIVFRHSYLVLQQHFFIRPGFLFLGDCWKADCISQHLWTPGATM